MAFGDFIAGDAIRQRREEMELNKLIAISQNPGNFGAASAGNAVAGAINSAFGLVTPKTQEMARLANRQDTMQKMMNSGIELGTPEAEDAFMKLLTHPEDKLMARMMNAELAQERLAAQREEEDRQFDKRLRLSEDKRAQEAARRDERRLTFQERAAEIQAQADLLDIQGQIAANSPEARLAAQLEKQAAQLAEDAANLVKLNENMRQDPAIKDYTQAALGAQAVPGALADLTGLGDNNLIKALIQVQEPGLAVGSSEFNAIADAPGSLLKSLGIPLIGGLPNGRILGDKQRQQIVNLISSSLNNKKRLATKQRSFFVNQGNKKGFNGEELPPLLDAGEFTVRQSGKKVTAAEKRHAETSQNIRKALDFAQDAVNLVIEQGPFDTAGQLLDENLQPVIDAGTDAFFDANKAIEEATGIPVIDGSTVNTIKQLFERPTSTTRPRFQRRP